MISPKSFVSELQSLGINFFAGVPDSLLRNICAYITDNVDSKRNIITANEGAAIGLAVGHYLGTEEIPVVYMQNSGEGNIVNPLLSLTDKEVYNIPILLVIGWRGKPGVKDEPQHVKQGKVTTALLDAMGVKWTVLCKNEKEMRGQLKEAVSYMTETKEAYALVVEKETFEDYKLQNVISYGRLSITREAAISIVAKALGDKDTIVSTTGMISRELFEYRSRKNEEHNRDFLTVGAMGHASQIALGIALSKPDRRVWCFDGDGASIMHMGSMAIIGARKPANYIHVIFNNGAHDSVGGQPTVGFDIDFCGVANAVGYNTILSVSDDDALQEALVQINDVQAPVLLEVKVKKGNRKDLGRPTITPVQNKEALIEFLKK